MWAMLIEDPAGMPVSVTEKVAVADVTFPDPSLTVSIVTVDVPCTVDSAFVTGGTSFAGESVAVKIVRFGLAEGEVGESESDPHPAANSASATIRIGILFMRLYSLNC